jgi:hypothetical protein
MTTTTMRKTWYLRSNNRDDEYDLSSLVQLLFLSSLAEIFFYDFSSVMMKTCLNVDWTIPPPPREWLAMEEMDAAAAAAYQNATNRERAAVAVPEMTWR